MDELAVSRYLGLDGFRGGWVAAWIDEQGNQGFDYSGGLNRLLSLPYRRAKDKIREVDDFITPERQATIGEAHPELIFFRINNHVRLQPKTSETGRNQRIGILVDRGFGKISKWLTQRHGTGIGRDDLIDACACAVAARDSIARFGGDEIDSRRLRMEINY